MKEVLRFLLHILFLSCFGFIPVSGFAQSAQPTEVFVDPSFIANHWTTQDGLPVNSVSKIIQSSDGYIWISTYDGLARFDGFQFKVFKSADYEDLPSNRIVTLTEASENTILLKTTTHDLVRFKDGNFKSAADEPGWNVRSVYSFFHAEDGKIWMGTSNGIMIYEHGKYIPFHPEVITGQVSFFNIDADGVLWYRENVSSKIYRFDGVHKTAIATDTGQESEPVLFKTLQNGNTLITAKNHLYLYKNNHVEELKVPLPDNFLVLDLFENTNGKVMLATKNHGLYELDGLRIQKIDDHFQPNLQAYTFINGHPKWLFGDKKIVLDGKLIFSSKDNVISPIFDQNGGLWFGTDSGGIFRLRPNYFKTYSESEGIPFKNVYPVYETADSSIWVGTYGKGPARIKNGKVFANYLFTRAPARQSTRAMIELETGEFVVSLASDGLYYFDEASQVFKSWDTPPAKPTIPRPITVESLFQDSRGWLWCGSDHGVYVRKNRAWIAIPEEESDPRHSVRNIKEAPDGSIWLATYGGGIQHYQDGVFTTYTTHDGLASNFNRYIYIDTTAEPGNYTLWVGTGDKGLNRINIHNRKPDLRNIITYNQTNGLYDNTVHVILPDKDGRFWMSGNTGISWVNRSELERFANGEIQHINTVYYTERDGLRNREGNGGVQTPGIISHDGTLWFATQDGVVEIQPGDLPRDSTATPIVIEEAFSGGEKRVRTDGKLVLEPEQRNFNISYAGLNFDVSKKIKYRYRLVGFNENWQDVGEQRTAFFTNVPAGNYLFQVISTNSQGLWNKVPVSQAVVIKPYFRETIWFKIIMLGLISVALWGVMQYRIFHLKKRERDLEQSIRERTAELEAEKRKTEAQAMELAKLDEFKSQFFTNITHEFRTPLTLIIGPLQKLLRNHGTLPAQKIQPELKRALNNSLRLQRLIDQILDLAKLEAGELALNIQKIDMVDFIRNIADMFTPLIEKQTLNLETKLPDSPLFVYADADALEKIISNLLSNAIKFTLPGGLISVQTWGSHDSVTFRISDNGIGIKDDQLPHIFDRFHQSDASATRIAEGTGIGLALVKNLVELHNAEIEVASEFGNGTTFTIQFKKGHSHFGKFELLPDEYKQKGKPVAEVHEKEAVLVSEDQPEFIASQDSPKPCVLVVEDNEEIRKFVASELMPTFSVIEAGDGEIALRLIKENIPDLIISDIMMPNMDGITLNEELKKDPMLEIIPIIFLTAIVGHEHMLAGLKKGVDDYLTKPFDSEILVARVENIIQKRRQLRQHILEYGVQHLSTEKPTDPFLERVEFILSKKFADPEFSVSELAVSLYLDRTQLYRKIKKRTDKTPQQFISDFRMKQAGRMLLERNGSISEIAYASGFNNMAYFSKVFRSYYNTSPTEYLSRSHSG